MQTTAVTVARNIILGTLVAGVRTELSTLRLELDGIGRTAQDNALISLQRDGEVVLYRNDNTRSLTARDHAAALDVAGFPRHLVYRLA